MGNYKSRPPLSCADELKKKISEGYAVVRSRLSDDIKPRFTKWTPLQIAAFKGTLQNIDELLKSEAIDDSTTSEELSLIHLVCAGSSQQQWQKIAHILDKCGEDDARRRSILSHTTRNGFTALHIAVFKDDLEAINALLDAGADPNEVGRNVLPPLHLAAMGGYADVARALIAKGAILHALDFVQFTALHCATYWGKEEVVEVLLFNGADPNYSGGVGDRPLHLASSKGSPKMVSLLLDVGADCLLADDEGNTALHFAAKTQYGAIVDLLLCKLGPKPQEAINKTNVYGDTPLHTACYAGRLESTKKLVMLAGTTVLATENVFSETPLHAACTSGKSIELVAFLLKQPGVDPNFQGQDGHTALHSACYHGHLRIVQYLLDNGADQSLTARAVSNVVAFQSVNANGYQSGPLSRLDSMGSLDGLSRTSSTAEDVQQTPIIWAYEKGHDPIVALLKHYANKRPESDVCSEYSSGDSSYTPLPSPLGRLHSVTKEKREILQLRAELSNQYHLSLIDLDFQEAIGSGSFGKVYKGVYKGRTVAIKRYRAVAFGSKSEVDMFCREVSILCKLQHTNVIAFVGACLDDRSQFAIVTEFVSSGSLFYLLHEQKKVLDQWMRLSIAVDVARGMYYLHEQAPRPVIHRDLNSHNILLHENGRAVVADFGESRFVTQRDNDNMTKQPGNLRWMAPEVFTQCGRYDRKVDVFSYALVVWEVHSCELPFGNLKPAAAAAEMAYKRARPPLPDGPTSQFPEYIISMLRQAWHSDATSRPEFAELLPPLEQQLAERPEPDDSATPVVSADESDDVYGTMRTVSRLKSQWEQLISVPREPVESSTTTISSGSTRTVEELRSRLDRNGYVLQPKFT
ncbi:hypothetical protein QR680_013769 [Steinernema hermaphroditum]|uniref:Protein kinase domain-containing protein n=1 Tax=Steinernema hermaphroditum TaxID=289476 RepID=A0AA39I6L6_9BILA|nr:hypothetical protein QR680_013769 [Steinernema hermaphroditum]